MQRKTDIKNISVLLLVFSVTAYVSGFCESAIVKLRTRPVSKYWCSQENRVFTGLGVAV
jgi:hypothetical protein